MIIIAALVVVTAAAYYYQGKQMPSYQSTVSLALSSQLKDSSEQSAAAPVDFSPRAATAESIIKVASEKSGMSAEALRAESAASLDSTTGNLTITVSASDPNLSKRAAEMVSGAYIAGLQDSISDYKDGLNGQLATLSKTIQQLQAKLPVPTKAVPNPRTDALLQAQIDSAVSRYTDISGQIQRINGLGEPAIVTTPAATGSLTTPSSVAIIGVGALAGALSGVGIALIWYFTNPRVRGEDDLEGEPRPAVLAVTPRYRDRGGSDGQLAIVKQPDSPLTEGIRALRTDVSARLSEGGAAIAVVSPGRRDGRSFIAANLAASFALSGRRTVLIFGDVRANGLDRYFNSITSRPTDEADDEPKTPEGKSFLPAPPVGPELEESAIENLYLVRTLVPSGAAADALAQESTRKAVEDLAGKADIVIIDTPALSDFADAAVLGSYSDGVIMIARRGRTTPAALQRAVDRIETAGARCLGVVLNAGG